MKTDLIVFLFLFWLCLVSFSKLLLSIMHLFILCTFHLHESIALLVGGLSLQQQQDILSRNPHVIIATPGRIIHHLEKTNGFRLTNLKFFVSFLLCYHCLSLLI